MDYAKPGPYPLVKLIESVPKWQRDPVKFFREELNVDPIDYQCEISQSLANPSVDAVAVRSGNGVGKSFIAACATIWFTYSFFPSLCVTTAPTWTQVENILWREVASRFARAPQLGMKSLKTKFELEPDQYAMGLSTDQPERFQGLHSPNILVIIDEASGVDDTIFHAIEGLTTSAHVKVLLLGNPTQLSGEFYDAFNKRASSYKRYRISAYDSPNVRAGQIVLPGLATIASIERKQKLWGKDSDLFRVRVDGDFPRTSANSLFPLDWILSAMQDSSAEARAA